MEAWANWVATKADPLKKIFFVTMSPTHLWSVLNHPHDLSSSFFYPSFRCIVSSAYSKNLQLCPSILQILHYDFCIDEVQ